ncbi:MAG: hypothetical protein Q8P49_02420 [Candidatus Liptonbacteria bacterium]|nr:hypothetical protein [Candidatus Liptonbacteria bacterium]
MTEEQDPDFHRDDKRASFIKILKEASAVLSHVRLIDSKRLVRKMGMLDEKIFGELKNALKRALFN